VVVSGADVGRDGGAVDAKAMGVSAIDDLLIRGDNTLDEGCVFGGCDFTVACESAEIVDGFEDDEPANSRGRQDVAIKASESAGTEAVDEKVIAANALVGDSDIARCE